MSTIEKIPFKNFHFGWDLEDFSKKIFWRKLVKHRFWPIQCRGGIVLAPLCLYFSCRRPLVLQHKANISSISLKLKKILTIIHGPSRCCANYYCGAFWTPKIFGKETSRARPGGPEGHQAYWTPRPNRQKAASYYYFRSGIFCKWQKSQKHDFGGFLGGPCGSPI